MPARVTTVIAAAIASAVALPACGVGPRPRFPSRDPMAVDPDMTPFLPRPAPYASPATWRAFDNTTLRPLVDALAVRRTSRALNVNALDEVADSSWFQDRLDDLVDDPAAFVRGACAAGAGPAPAGPWTVVGAMPLGVVIADAAGARYAFAPDGGPQGERQSVAELIGTRVYHAAGFNTACTRIVALELAAFAIAPAALTEDVVGKRVPFTRAMLEAIAATAAKDGRGAVRGSLSPALPGITLGPWRELGVRADDPNDVVAHEDRRELRGSYVLGAWLGHDDARELASMDMWEAPSADAPGFVRHYQLDFTDCLGSLRGTERAQRRHGHVHELDWSVALVELVTLGVLPRSWRAPARSPGGMTLGYFTVEALDPDGFRTAHPYGPYTRVTEADAAWGARILARITPAMIRALVASARLRNPAVERALIDTLLGRRERLLRRYLTRLSPLARPRVDDAGRLCVTDARIEGELVVRGQIVAQQQGAGALAVAPGATAAETCVGPIAATPDGVAIIELRADTTRPLRVQLFRAGDRYRIAGLDRE